VVGQLPRVDRFWEGAPSEGAPSLFGSALPPPPPTVPPCLEVANVEAIRNVTARVIQEALALAAERTDRPIPRRLDGSYALRCAADLWALGLPRLHPFWPSLASAALSSPLTKTAESDKAAKGGGGSRGPRITVAGAEDFKALRMLKELATAALTDAGGAYTKAIGPARHGVRPWPLVPRLPERRAVVQGRLGANEPSHGVGRTHLHTTVQSGARPAIIARHHGPPH
jgi:hypothetical protein